LLVGARCILGYLADSSPHKSPLEASSIKGADQEDLNCTWLISKVHKNTSTDKNATALLETFLEEQVGGKLSRTLALQEQDWTPLG